MDKTNAKSAADKAKETKGTLIGKKQYKINVEVPEHTKELAYILKYNHGVRRLTSLAIIKHLKETGELGEDDKVFVNFVWNKFTVSVGNINRDYKYTEPFFLTALNNAFVPFTQNSIETIKKFMSEEGIKFVEE